MRKFQVFRFLMLSILPVFILIPKVAAQSHLKSIFLTPPDDSKPRGYWLWGQGNFDYTRIGEELKAYKEMGYGGVDIFDLGIADPYDIVPSGPAYMSDEQLDGVVYAMKEAKKLGLKMGMSVSNGWNAGGDWTTPDEMSMNMLFWKDTIQGPISISKIGFPIVPRSFDKLYGTYPLYPVIGKDGFPEYYKNVSLVAFPLTNDGKINQLKDVITFDASQIKGNNIDIQLPAGKWVLLRSVVTPLGQKMWAASDRSKGFIMDHFSEKATKHHFSYLFDKLESRMGTLKGSAFDRFYLASFESEAKVEWSPYLADYFFKLNGYHIEPFIPALAGEQVIDDETTQRFIHDYRLTISEMFVNNHYRQARKLCHDHGVLLASESGGPGPPLHRVPTEDYMALGAVDVMRGEFWNNINAAEFTDARGGDILSVVKNIAGAAHVYGRKVVEMESFTGRKHWRETPFQLKVLADYAFCNGMTRVVYHTGTLSPKEAGKPGWSYSAGTHVSPNLTWWSLSKPMHDYFARVGGMLQQGNFVADVAYYKGEEVPNFGIGYKYEKETLGAGYDYDDINTEILLQTSEVVNGKIKLPCGMTYSMLVLKDNGKMSIEVLRVLDKLIAKGATVIGKKPTTVYGLSNYKAREAEMLKLADKIWGANPVEKQIKKYGKGTIITGYTEKEILSQKGIVPDFVYRTNNKSSKLAYIHRSTDTEEIYFVSNTDSVSVNTQLQFRATGMQPQLWNPTTLETKPLAVYTEWKKTTTIPLQMEAHGSMFVIFSKEKPSVLHITSVTENKNTIFPSATDVSDVAFEAALGANGAIKVSGSKGTYNLSLSDGSKKVVTIQPNESTTLQGPWDVRFAYGWGFNAIQQFDILSDWLKNPNPEIAAYSGLASYKLAFTLPAGFLRSDRAFQIDLGKVGEVARVFLNGTEVGTTVFEPHQLSLNNVLREGENNLVVEVANTWLNQYLYDLKKAPEQKRLNTNVSKGDFLKAGNQPLSSGLIGPVQIVSLSKNELK
ncbi:MAG: glycosyl hydrolase [Bacteroidales bacterium]|nr:glycosyl hydrolase [Bacteroidales bacterium]